MMDISTFELKVELLFKGFKILDLEKPGMDQESEIDKVARKGGAGPAGGMFVQYHDKFQANVPMQELMVEKSDLYIKEITNRGIFDILKDTGDGGCEKYKRLIKIPPPNFYDDTYVKKEQNNVGTPISFKKIALIHGKDCVATTINQSCKYWKEGSQCLFCAIEESLKGGDTLKKKDPDALVAFTEKARKEKRVKHYTLTSGTQEGPDGGALEYIPFVKALKSNFKYPVHVQMAPVSKYEYLDKLYYAGVDNIGIHLETYPDSIRKEMCPGKSSIPIKSFIKNWKYAVDLFGPNQVESYLLVGLGENFDQFKRAVEIMVENEVIPFIVPARPIKNTKFDKNQLNSYKFLVNYYQYAGIRLHEQGLKPWKAVAGCVRCGACSAIGEATRVAQKFP